MVHHDDERVRVRIRENERDKLTEKKKKTRKKAEGKEVKRRNTSYFLRDRLYYSI